MNEKAVGNVVVGRVGLSLSCVTGRTPNPPPVQPPREDDGPCQPPYAGVIRIRFDGSSASAELSAIMVHSMAPRSAQCDAKWSRVKVRVGRDFRPIRWLSSRWIGAFPAPRPNESRRYFRLYRWLSSRRFGAFPPPRPTESRRYIRLYRWLSSRRVGTFPAPRPTRKSALHPTVPLAFQPAFRGFSPHPGRLKVGATSDCTAGFPAGVLGPFPPTQAD